MNTEQLTNLQEQYEQTLTQLQRDVDRAARAGDRGTVDIIQDTYAAYQRKLDNVNEMLGL